MNLAKFLIRLRHVYASPLLFDTAPIGERFADANLADKEKFVILALLNYLSMLR